MITSTSLKDFLCLHTPPWPMWVCAHWLAFSVPECTSSFPAFPSFFLSKNQNKFPSIWLLSNIYFVSLCVSCRKSVAVCVRWQWDICVNESQVWSTLNGVNKRVGITFQECEGLKNGKLWSNVSELFWVGCPSKESWKVLRSCCYFYSWAIEKEIELVQDIWSLN